MNRLLDERAISGRLGRASPNEAPRRSRNELLLRISRFYASQGVLGQRSAPALHERCPDADACWKQLPLDARPRPQSSWAGFKQDRAGSIVWPWVGRNYETGGVAVAGLNLRTNWEEPSVALEYMIADNDREQFVNNRRRSKHDSNFAYRSMSAAAAIVASRLGQRLEARPSPDSLVAVMEQVARVQLVKCNPNAAVVDRGTPSPTMCQRCPDRFLLAELRALAPGALVMLGHDAFRAMNNRSEVRWRSLRDYYGRGTLSLLDQEVELFWLPHPSGSQWTHGHESLVRSLRARRVGAA